MGAPAQARHGARSCRCRVAAVNAAVHAASLSVSSKLEAIPDPRPTTTTATKQQGRKRSQLVAPVSPPALVGSTRTQTPTPDDRTARPSSSPEDARVPPPPASLRHAAAAGRRTHQTAQKSSTSQSRLLDHARDIVPMAAPASSECRVRGHCRYLRTPQTSQ
jgi:hypothetical protein